jgi:hypothetical protein
LEKDSFSAQILHEASNEAEAVLSFWENWGNARTNRIEPKGGSREGEDALREF